jgi:hypothetical protein
MIHVRGTTSKEIPDMAVTCPLTAKGREDRKRLPSRLNEESIKLEGNYHG